MKNPLLVISACLAILVSGCSSNPTTETPAGNVAAKTTVLEAACGQCMFGLEGKAGCDLAVRVDGKSYFVDGFSMGQLGDAHAKDGMCNTIRKANIMGSVKNGRFTASTFELLPVGK